MHTEPIVALKNISFAYGSDLVLDGVNLEISKGDYLGIIGPNGGGKSTLLKLMLGLLVPLHGEIELFGKSLDAFKEWASIGYVSQKSTHIDPDFPMTVEGVVSMGRYEKKGPFRFLDGHDKKKIAEALRHVGMEDLKDRLIGDLSGGQQQRVFVARALAGEPRLIILDEPTVGIDADTQTQLYELFRYLNRTMKITLILVSHDLDIVEKEANDLLCIDRVPVYHGTPENFRTHPDYALHKGIHIPHH